MKFLVEMDLPITRQRLDDIAARPVVEELVFRSLDRAETLVKQGCILAGGPVAGRTALRFIAEVESIRHLDELVSSIPLWPVAYTRVTALIEFSDRRPRVQTSLQRQAMTLPNAAHQPIV